MKRENTHIYFASDFHLGVPSFEASLKREKLICRWLESIRSKATEIYLLGDVFDFWFEYRDVVPKGYTRLLGLIAAMSDEGIRFTLFKGNHDMWTFGYLEKELGIKVISDELIIVREDKKFYLHHGDGLGPGDYGYKIIKKIFRNKLSVLLFGFLHPFIGAGLAKYLSKKSRISKGNNDKTYLGDDKEFIPLFCKEMLSKEHFDYFICGHRHFPIDLKLNENSRYINLGEWVSDFTYAEFDGTKLELKKFEG
ncbi:MAG: UDP-2,3-diacylglucosamine diphosphatase [Bacteroidia bacterium]|nr:UDP-2,3-diacylglucosamine diphosphatase [Bacteroidia bacterium]